MSVWHQVQLWTVSIPCEDERKEKAASLNCLGIAARHAKKTAIAVHIHGNHYCLLVKRVKWGFRPLFRLGAGMEWTGWTGLDPPSQLLSDPLFLTAVHVQSRFKLLDCMDYTYSYFKRRKKKEYSRDFEKIWNKIRWLTAIWLGLKRNF